MKRLQAFKFQLRPDGQQELEMRRFAGACRFVLNRALALQNENHEAGNKYISYAKLLGSSDIVIPLLPLTDRTYHLFGRDTLARMKKGSYLVNVCRGSVMDEMAVTEFLEKRHLTGYAADVFEMEDWIRPGRPHSIPEALLENTEQTFFTPHLGSAVDDVRVEIERYCARNILQAQECKILDGKVNDVR